MNDDNSQLIQERIREPGLLESKIKELHITDRKKTEEMLQDSEEKYRTLYESSSDAIMLLDEKGFFDCNNSTLVIFGFSKKEDFIKVHPADVSPPYQPDGVDSLTAANKKIAEAFSKGTNFFEWMHRRQNGEDFPADVLLTAFNFKGKQVLQATVRDITERKRIENAIKESENKFRSIFDNARDGILLADIENKKFHTGNKMICQMLGYELEEIGHIGVMDIHTAESLPDLIDRFERMVSGEISVIEDIPVKRKDGSIFYADVNSSPVIIEGKTYLLGIFRDITEHKKIEEKLRESEERYRSLVETTSDWIWEVDANCIYTYVSPKIRELLGYEPQEIIGRTPFDLMPPEEAERVAAMFNPIIESHMSFFGLENLNLRKDGGKAILETSGVPIFDVDGKFCGYRGIDRDITERKKAEEALKKALQELKDTHVQLLQAGKLVAMGEMAAGTAHELTQPLTGIKGFSTAMLEDIKLYRDKKVGNMQDAGLDIERVASDLEVIVKQTDRMNEIINAIRSFAHSSGTEKLQIPINKPVEDALMLFSQQLSLHNITVEKNLTPDLFVSGNANQLSQVFIILITNAMDAKGKGGKGHLRITTGKVNSSVVIRFEDTGIGADEETVKRMFTPFFTTKKVGSGIGLGLVIASRIINDHKGKINVECKPGKGCKFTILLPSVTGSIL